MIKGALISLAGTLKHDTRPGLLRVIFLSQHVVGMGHFFRVLEICRALKGCQAGFVSGGRPLPLRLPAHVRLFELPDLFMDPDFTGFRTTEPRGVEWVKRRRTQLLLEIFQQFKPHVFVCELFPFGRKAFGFELDPLLEAVEQGRFGPMKLLCSLRDILVEKENPAKHEARAVKLFNRFFNGLLVHSDPTVIRLDESFSRVKDLRFAPFYTGYVTPQAPRQAKRTLRRCLGLEPGRKMVVASAGSGAVGRELLQAAAAAFELAGRKTSLGMFMFTGPHVDDALFQALKRQAGPRVRIKRFTHDFLSYLAAADLSISMAGYNTCANLLAANTPALVFPFVQNREQALRAGRLAGMAGFTVLESLDLEPTRLACAMLDKLAQKIPVKHEVDLGGAQKAAMAIISMADKDELP